MKPAALCVLPHCGADTPFEFQNGYRFLPDVPRRSRLVTAIIPCLCGIGCLYQVIAAARDRLNFPPPGEMVPVDGLQMHLQLSGCGAPTVVLETGLGGMSSAWGWIQPETAKFCRVAAYDRAGLGWSETDNSPKSAHLAAHRLRALLHAARVPPPFVLVGHSMGGLLVRVFASCYPDEVTGMVLLDACHPDQHLRSPAIGTHMRTGFRVLRNIPVLTRLGYVRLTGFFNAWADGLPPRQAAEAEAFLSSESHLRTTREESLAWESLCAEVRGASELGNIPLAVVTAGKDVLPGHPELHGELAALSRDSVHLAVKGADHVTLVTNREHALAVVEVIRHVVNKGMARCHGRENRLAHC
jgi:pimeloyl-ACP methyl ester carboxylesterase